MLHSEQRESLTPHMSLRETEEKEKEQGEEGKRGYVQKTTRGNYKGKTGQPRIDVNEETNRLFKKISNITD